MHVFNVPHTTFCALIPHIVCSQGLASRRQCSVRKRDRPQLTFASHYPPPPLHSPLVRRAAPSYPLVSFHRSTAPPFHHFTTQGCPVCKSLCCCNKGRAAVCTRKYHCYKKCVAPSGRSRREEADGAVVAPTAAAPAAPMGAGVVGGPPRGAIGGYDAIQGGIKRALAAKLFHQYTAGGGGQIAGAGPAGADAPAEEVVTVFNNRQNPLAIQPIAVQGGGQHIIAPNAKGVAVPDDPDEYDENMHAFNAPTRVIAVAEEEEGIRPMFTISASSQHVRHRVSCHRCGNLRKNNVLCIRCPHIFCKRCADKMTAEHGRNVFEGGTFSVGVWARRVSPYSLWPTYGLRHGVVAVPPLFCRGVIILY